MKPGPTQPASLLLVMQRQPCPITLLFLCLTTTPCLSNSWLLCLTCSLLTIHRYTSTTPACTEPPHHWLCWASFGGRDIHRTRTLVIVYICVCSISVHIINNFITENINVIIIITYCDLLFSESIVDVVVISMLSLPK